MMPKIKTNIFQISHIFQLKCETEILKYEIRVKYKKWEKYAELPYDN